MRLIPLALTLCCGLAVLLLAGSPTGESGTTDGGGSAARFSNPLGIALDRVGHLYVTETGNHRIRRITPDGVVSTFAGPTGTVSAGYADGPDETARFDRPFGIAVDAAGYVYVSESSGQRIRRISPGRVTATVAGTGASALTDGPGTTAAFRNPWGLALDAAGNLYVGDQTALRLVQRVIGQ